MDQLLLRRGTGALATLLALAAVVVVTRGVSPPQVAPPEPFPIAKKLAPSDVMKKRRPRRPVPAAPQIAPEGALIEHNSGLKSWDIAPGRGEPPRAGQIVVVEYTGWLEDGRVFDSSLERIDPMRFAVGMGRIFEGLDEGVSEMRAGGIRQLIVPPDLGFGEQGIEGRIPPNATLICEVKLLEIYEVPEAIPSVPEPRWRREADGLMRADLSLGAGPSARANRSLLIDYTMWVEAPSLETPTRIDSSLERPSPVRAKPGALFPAWERGMRGMRLGGRRVLRIPPELAFGAEGKPPTIPPDGTLTIEVILRRIE